MSMTVQLHRPVAPTFDVYGDPAFAALHATDTGGNRVTLFFADKAAAVAWLTDAIVAAQEAQACDCGKPAGHAGPCDMRPNPCPAIDDETGRACQRNAAHAGNHRHEDEHGETVAWPAERAA